MRIEIMKIKKKVDIKYFQDVLGGKKNFEVRLADWEINEGDILVLQEWDPGNKEYTGREIEKEATYVVKTKDIDYFVEEEIKKYGWQVIGFK